MLGNYRSIDSKFCWYIAGNKYPALDINIPSGPSKLEVVIGSTLSGNSLVNYFSNSKCIEA